MTPNSIKITGIALVILFLVILPASGELQTINPGATVFIGESGLDITQAIGTSTTIAWWAPGTDIHASAPAKVLAIGNCATRFAIRDSEFAGHTGNWYQYDEMKPTSAGPLAFAVVNPTLDIQLIDADTQADVTWTAVPPGSQMAFRIVTNQYATLDPVQRPNANPVTDGYVTVTLMDETGKKYTELYDASALSHPLGNLAVDKAEWYWGGAGQYSWDTNSTDGSNARRYPYGTYAINAKSNLNGLRNNYKDAGSDYTGKTVSEREVVILNLPNPVIIEEKGVSLVEQAAREKDTAASGANQYPNVVQPMLTITPDSALSLSLASTEFSPADIENGYVAGEVIVRYKPETVKKSLNGIQIESTANIEIQPVAIENVVVPGTDGIQRVKLRSDTLIKDAIAAYKRDPYVLWAQPNYIYHIDTVPNDPEFGHQWALHNTGQLVNDKTGTADADIDAPEAWDSFTVGPVGSNSVVIAVLDSGLDYTNPEFTNNLWNNPGETGLDSNGRDKRFNKIDDDGSGIADDWMGWNMIDKNGDITDEIGHGTQIAAIVGAIGNNGNGIAGINWNVKILPVKIVNNAGYVSDLRIMLGFTQAYEYGNARIMVCPWSSMMAPDDEYVKDFIAKNNWMLFVFPAGNSGTNNDVTPYYPASYPYDNIISVGASNQLDNLAGFSNYGSTSVDLAAPGENILLPKFGGGYEYRAGTSYAASMVAGIAGLIRAIDPSANPVTIKNTILQNVDKKSSLSGKVYSGGRLNANNALLATSVTVPPMVDFKADVTSGKDPLVVHFTDTSTAVRLSSRTYDFGDGASSWWEANPTHPYHAGTYTVTLTERNNWRVNSSTKTNYIVVDPPTTTPTPTPTLTPTPTATVTVTPTPTEYTYSITQVGNPGGGFDDISSEIGLDATMLSHAFENDPKVKWTNVLWNKETAVTKADLGTDGGGLNDAIFHFHAGHGAKDWIFLGNTYLALSNGQTLHANEVKGMWGKNNKWVWLHSCEILSDQSWSQALSNTHGIFGYTTRTWSGAKEKTDFIELAQGMAWHQGRAKPLSTAFYDATRRNQPQSVTAAVIFGNKDQYDNDYLPGHGSMAPDKDPSDHSYFYNEWQCAGKEVTS